MEEDSCLRMAEEINIVSVGGSGSKDKCYASSSFFRRGGGRRECR